MSERWASRPLKVNIGQELSVRRACDVEGADGLSSVVGDEERGERSERGEEEGRMAHRLILRHVNVDLR